MFSIFYAIIWVVTWLPLWCLYLLSDFLFILVYFIVGYRKPIVRKNLKNSFPNKDSKELKSIERKFYRFFCDLFIESLYEMHISKKEMLKRMNFSNIDIILEQYEKGKSCMLMTAHYGNWEWASGLSLLLPDENPSFNIYKRLKNKNFDALMCELRAKCNGRNVEKNDLLRTMIQLKQKSQVAMFGMISDQSPQGSNVNYWTDFLHQDTAVFTGTEVLARKFDYPVFYASITRKKRGYYNLEFIPIAMEPAKTAEFEITEKYIRLLEESIQSQPAYWLWSHKRWKQKRKNIQ